MILTHTMRADDAEPGDREEMRAEGVDVDTAVMTALDAAVAAADAGEELRVALGLPGRLRDVGVPEEGLELIAAATLQDRALATNPRPVTDAGPIMTVLRNSW